MYRSIVLTFFLASLFSLSVAYAEESKSEWVGGGVHTTPHPPHDHPDHDHLKKLDEGLRKSKRKEEEEKV